MSTKKSKILSHLACSKPRSQAFLGSFKRELASVAILGLILRVDEIVVEDTLGGASNNSTTHSS